MIILPGYCPGLNPDELLNQDVKTNALGKSRPTKRAEMMATLRAICIGAKSSLRLSKTCSKRNMSDMLLDKESRTIWRPPQ